MGLVPGPAVLLKRPCILCGPWNLSAVYFKGNLPLRARLRLALGLNSDEDWIDRLLARIGTNTTRRNAVIDALAFHENVLHVRDRILAFDDNGIEVDVYRQLVRQARNRNKVSPLRPLDLMLKGCCRNQRGTEKWLPVTHQLAGINQKSFNRAFHQLVLSAVRALDVLPNLTYLRIRFIDFDWKFPFQNPYFELIDQFFKH